MKSWMLGFYAVLLLWLLVLFSSQGGCLTTTDTKVPLKNLLSYTIQSKPLFSVDADWRGSSETTETFQLDGPKWEEGGETESLLMSSTIMHEPYIINDALVISSCLTTTDTKVPLKNLLSYTIQSKPLFSVDAARFLTIKRKIICSDPSSSWAKKAMNYLDEKNKKLQSVSNKTAH
uniref:Chemokine interleukin-8-like domain-containing protein n=1 Tax=Cyprinus carpio TaxID=7962 RepID=A0A8C2L0H3_CYPCA